MNRVDLEHIIRAAAEIANDEIIVIGSQAILGSFPDAPKELLVSTEADVYPKNRPDRADLIDGSIGQGSPFHETYGYYAQGVHETTAILPRGWRDRFLRVQNENTRGNTGWSPGAPRSHRFQDGCGAREGSSFSRGRGTATTRRPRPASLPARRDRAG